MALNPFNLSDNNRKRVNRILEVIISYARLDFSAKTDITGNNDVLDAIGAGVNMLGEELENSTISLKEKEQLLKEVHHRVKNNLQVVSSLLKLQSENVLDPKFLDMIEDSRRRIHSMALVHEMLYSARDLSRVQIDSYISHLCEQLRVSHARPDQDIGLDLKIQKGIFFDIDKLIPIGLILNETISNAYKHAFVGNAGTIAVELHVYDGQYTLRVSDNGRGITEPSNRKSLGTQLIQMLAEQMDGKLTVTSDHGTIYELDFK